MRTIATILALIAVALAAAAFAQETTIKVPQGSGVFPTVGQVNCLEELGTGRLCAATYQCSEGSGRLWGDLANHDGRRAINQDSPVARGRDCTITVDGRAAVRWLTAYAPRGRDSELAGLTTSEDALRPVVRGGSTSTVMGEDGRPLLAYILQRHNTTLADIADLVCEGQEDVEGARARMACEDGLLRNIFGEVTPGVGYGYHQPPIISRGDAGFADLQENEVTRCLVELYEASWFCDAHTGIVTVNAPQTQSCAHDSRLMPYHLIKWPDLYWTFSAIAAPDGTAYESDLNELTDSAQGQRCAAIAIDRLQQQYGVELIEYDAARRTGWMTIGD